MYCRATLSLAAIVLLSGPLAAAQVSTDLSVVATDDTLLDATRPLSYVWNLVNGPEGGSVIFTPSATVTNPSVTFDAPGIYTVRITVSDGHLATSQVLQLSVASNEKRGAVPAESSSGGGGGGCGAGGGLAVILGASLFAFGSQGRRRGR
jgi:hypothetical protein